jgi:hypothetical protein
MAANTRTRLPFFGYNTTITGAEFTKMDKNGAEGINRHNTAGGWGAVPFHYVGEYSTGGSKLVYAVSGGVYMDSAGSTKSGTSTYSLDLRPMIGHLLAGVRLHITPHGGHAGAPGQLPVITLYKVRVGTGVALNLGTATYTWGAGDPVDYEAGFHLTVSPAAETIDTENFHYLLQVEIESGAGAVDDGRLDGIEANVTVNAAEGGPDITFWP